MPAEPTLRGVFVTGTDTGVGKTLVTAALTLMLRDRDLNLAAMKPVETGVDDPGAPGPDAALLRWAAGWEGDPDLIAPYRFRAPLAPSLAAEKEGERIAFPRIADAVRELGQNHEFLIVEGAGGLMVPLAGGLLMADLVRELALPLLVVSRPDLGTINHTLLTVFAARSMGLPLAGIIINGMPDDPDEAQADAPHAIASLASADLLGVLPRVAGDDREKARLLADRMAALSTLPWLLAGLGLK